MIDYHIHSSMSGDSNADIMMVCRAAVDSGFSEICFTEHMDFEPTDMCYGCFDYALIAERIGAAREAYVGKLDIRLGVEVDFQDKYRSTVRDFLQDKDFDYILGAAHYCDGVILEDHQRYFPGKTDDEAYIPYFQNVLTAVETGFFDSLAHIDLCKRYGVRYFGPFRWESYQQITDSILKAVIRKGMTLEINTSGLRQSPEETYPGEEILARYFSLGGRNITVGSDSHKVEDTGSGIKSALGLAARIGFKSVDTYKNRKRQPKSISEMLTRADTGTIGT